MMSSSEPSSISLGPLQPVKKYYTRYMRQYRQLLDRAAPHLMYRWLGAAGLLAIFMLRILLSQAVSNRIRILVSCAQPRA